MPLSTTPRLAFGLNTRPPRSYSCVYHLASLPAEAFGCVIGVSFGAEFPLGGQAFQSFCFSLPFCLILLRFLFLCLEGVL